MKQRTFSQRSLTLAVALGLHSVAGVAQTQETGNTNSSTEDAQELDTIEVKGVRGAIFSARSQEREKSNIVSIVTSDDVGQFPDQSVAESLQRVVGISVDRDAGEARRLSVRGLGPLFNPVRINGAQLGTSDTDRDAVIDVLPNDLLGNLEVSKTLTPDMDADAIGGAVNLVPIDPFERESGGTIRLEANQQDYSGKTIPKGGFIYTGSRDSGEGRLGFTLAASYAERDLEGDVFRNRDTPVLSRVGQDCSAPAPDCFLRSVRVEQRYDQSERERLGVAAGLNLQTGNGSEFFLKYIRSEFNRQDTQWTNSYRFGSNSATAIGPRSGSFRNAELRKQVTLVSRDETTSMLQIGGEHAFDLWRVGYMAARSNSDLDFPEQLTGRFRIRGINADVQLTDTFSFVRPISGTASSANFDNLANFAFDNLTNISEVREDVIDTAKLDLERAFEWGDYAGSFKFGAKATRRDKSIDRDEVSGNPSGAGGVAPATLASIASFVPNTRITGFGIHPTSTAVGTLFRSATGALTPVPANSAALDLSVGENVDALYLMGTLELSESLSLIGGFRYEDTTWTTSGKEVETFDPLTGSDVLTVRDLGIVKNTYSDVLPSVHLRWLPSENTIFWASFSSALVRPNFDEGANTRTVTTREITGAPGTFNRSFSGGNPLLDPLKAKQVDLLLGWYPTDTTYVSAGLFYKDINDFYVAGNFVGADVARLGLPVGNGTRNGGFDSANVILNGNSAKVKGAEFAFEQAFTNLPGWWSGLFVAGNLTILDSEADVGILRPGERLPLADQADEIANLSLGWENDAFTFRVSGNFRGEQLDTISSNPQLDQILQDYFGLDLNLRYNFSDRWQVYFDASNITSRKDITIFRGDGSGGFSSDEAVNDFGPSYGLGVRWNF
jgi:TonB-dependent receptor